MNRMLKKIASKMQQLSSPEAVRMINDPGSGLDGVIVIHSTVLGPAVGGCRFRAYATTDDMVGDAVRLAEGMSFKNAIARLPFGGGKAVLRQPVHAFDRLALFRAFGQAVDELGGRYVTAEDVGTSVEDMIAIAESTRHVAGLPSRGDRPGGDPSPSTARGVLLSMATAVEKRLDRPLAECKVAIQGLGHVGRWLAQMLHVAGARLLIADVLREKVDQVAAELNATAVSADEILSVDADVFAPCALGGVLSNVTIRSLRAKVVCGAANNQLLTESVGDQLAEMGVLYAPDYVVNAGGIISVAAEKLGWSKDKASRLLEETGQRLAKVLEIAAQKNLAPHRAAAELARSIIAEAVADNIRDYG